MWFGLAKMAISTGAKIYANKQKQKEAMSQAALLTAEKMARGETCLLYTSDAADE